MVCAGLSHALLPPPLGTKKNIPSMFLFVDSGEGEVHGSPSPSWLWGCSLTSSFQNVYAPEEDPELRVEHYERSFEQNEDLGLNDMKTEDYETEPHFCQDKPVVGDEKQ